MGKLKAKKPKSDLTRVATVGDLKSLVTALGQIVGEAVEKAVRDELRPLREDFVRFEGTNRDLSKLVDASLMLGLQQIAQERDVEHRAYLGGADAKNWREFRAAKLNAQAQEDALKIAQLRAAQLMIASDGRTPLKEDRNADSGNAT